MTVSVSTPSRPSASRLHTRSPSDGGGGTQRRIVPSPVGPLTVEAAGDVLTRLAMGQDAADHAAGVAEAADSGVAGASAGVLDDAAAQLGAYFAGRLTRFDLPLATDGTAFQRIVWAVLREVPYGETVSYGELAVLVGRPGAARAVGSANARNPIALIVPCHRVIGAGGTLTGYAYGIERKRWLIDHEARHRPA